MRGLRSTIAFVVVLAGLSAYIYFVTWKKSDDAAQSGKERAFAGLQADKIDEVTVKSESGDTTTLKKTGGTWQMTAPLAGNVDEAEVSAITSNLGTLDVTRVVEDNPADLKDYGLDAPRATIDFKAEGDKTGHRLLIGSKSPTGSDIFVKRDSEKRVVLVPGFADSVLNRSTFDLREKTLAKFDRDKVDRISVSTPAKTLEFAKNGAEWTITKPVALRADTAAVDSLLGRLQTAAMKKLVVEQATPADLKMYGFEKPQATLTAGVGTASSALVVGGSVGENEVYVRNPARSLIATADGGLLKDVQKGVDDYRRKEVFSFLGFTTDRLEFARDGQATVFEKVKSQSQAPDKWHRASPNPGDPSVVNMEALIAKLETLRASSFVDSTAKTGLDKPTLTVYAKFESGKKEERVSFAKNGMDVFGAVAGQPGGFKVLTSEFDEAVKALDEVAK